MNILGQALKQTWQLLKKDLYISVISIIGTAIAITLIMAQMLSIRGEYMNIEPEINREKTLYVKWVGLVNKETGEVEGTGYLSRQTIKACFQSLELPEMVVVTSPLQTRLASIPGSTQKQAFILFTDEVFWRATRFNFLDGTHYTGEEVDAGIPKVVLSEQLARTLFGTVDQVVGKQIHLSYNTYTVCGIVKDVTTVCTYSYAQAWVSFTSAGIPDATGVENITGNYKCQLVARSKSDLPAIRKEVERKVLEYNSSLSDYDITLFRQPDTKFTEGKRFGAGYPDMNSTYISTIILICIVLLVPAINLSGFTLARMKERMAELGIRRSFGATKKDIFGQILWENMLYSLAGGVLGLLIVYIIMFKTTVFLSVPTDYDGLDVIVDSPDIIFFQPVIFFWALLFCSALNILSAGIPAWRVASLPVVESLKGE